MILNIQYIYHNAFTFKDIAAEIDSFMKKNGADDIAFSTIAAAVRRLSAVLSGMIASGAVLLLGSAGLTLEAAFPAGRTVTAGAEIALGTAGIFTLGLGLQTLDGQIDLAVFIADDHDLHILTLGQMGSDVADIGVGHLGNMYHAGLVLRQGHEGAEIGDGLDFSL